MELRTWQDLKAEVDQLRALVRQYARAESALHSRIAQLEIHRAGMRTAAAQDAPALTPCHHADRVCVACVQDAMAGLIDRLIAQADTLRGELAIARAYHAAGGAR